MNCPYCNNETIHKNGNKYNKQRYICPKCGKSFSLSDNRVKRNNKEREMALLLYCHNMSLRSIQNVLNKYFNTNIAFNVIDNWIKTNAKQLRLDVNNNRDNNNNNNKPKTIEILELDELYTYFYDIKKNNEKTSKYGLLLTETEIKLLHIK